MKETGGLVPGVTGVVELGGGREVIVPAASLRFESWRASIDQIF
jgi:hypothetical protein